MSKLAAEMQSKWCNVLEYQTGKIFMK